MSPRISKEREAEVRQRILEAGIRVFERRGFDQASMAAIAVEADMSAGGIYTHFASKEELFLNAFASLVEDEERTLEQALVETTSVNDAVDLVVEYIVQVATGVEGDFRGAGSNFLLHAWATAEQNPALRELLQRRRAGASGLARTIIDGAVARAELSSGIDTEGLALAFVSVLDGLFLQRAERGEGLSAGDARRQLYAVVDAIFSHPPRPAETGHPSSQGD